MTTNARGATRLKIWLAVLGVFALGCATGVLLDSAYRLHGREGRDVRRGGEEMFEGMKRDLNLNEQQATEVRRILEQTRGEYRALRSEIRPRYDTLRQNSRAQLRALLNPEQQRLFDAHAAERDARRSEEERQQR